MRTRPEALDESALLASLTDAWGVDVEVARYAEVGFGSYHWAVTDREQRRWFVTVDDLDQKPWLGETRDRAFGGLRRAFETAASLRDAGLAFVVAPVRTRDGEALLRIAPKYSVALFPFVEGEAGQFGDFRTAEARAAVVATLAELHRATPIVRAVAREDTLALDGRRDLEAGLRDRDLTWEGGPFSESARDVVARYATDLEALLAAFDRLERELAPRMTTRVITHGEPHPANVLQASDGLMLVDWDTVALAPPERDLWMVVSASGEEAALYAEATGHRVDSAATDFFGMRWDLADLAAYVTLFRSAHRESADTIQAFEGLTWYATNARERWSSRLR